MTKRKPKTRPSKLEWQKQKRAEWKAQGLCGRCGGVRAWKQLRSGKRKKMASCQPCLDYAAKQ